LEVSECDKDERDDRSGYEDGGQADDHGGAAPPAEGGADGPGEAGVAERDRGRYGEVEYREDGEEADTGDGGVSQG
jgi:hypothetical protein